jgi:hypothetical protein
MASGTEDNADVSVGRVCGALSRSGTIVFTWDAGYGEGADASSFGRFGAIGWEDGEKTKCCCNGEGDKDG